MCAIDDIRFGHHLTIKRKGHHRGKGYKVILNRKEKRRVEVLVESMLANREREQDSVAKVTFGGPFGTVPELLFDKK